MNINEINEISGLSGFRVIGMVRSDHGAGLSAMVIEAIFHLAEWEPATKWGTAKWEPAIFVIALALGTECTWCRACRPDRRAPVATHRMPHRRPKKSEGRMSFHIYLAQADA